MCGGAVPADGSILNVSQMKKITGFSFDSEKKEGSITLEPGVTLRELKQYLKKKRIDTSVLSKESLKDWEEYQNSSYQLWFLPNPTEKEATLGGIVATNAIGGHIGAGGEIEENILSMKVIGWDGEVICVKNHPEIEEFCGTEGAKGVITELTLKLVKYPVYRWGLFSFHHSYENMETFYHEFSENLAGVDVKIGATDWFSKSCDRLAEKEKAGIQAAGTMISFPGNAACALWTELWGEEENQIFTALETALELLEPEDDFCELALAATNETEFARLESYRHMITEMTGLYHDKKAALLDWKTENPMQMAKNVTELLDSVEYALLGHMHDGLTTLHILDAVDCWENMVQEILHKENCQYSTEHGCGKRKKNFKMSF